MAVLIASDLGKDVGGEALLRGVSFKLERRERMTLSGRNGAGKTTLLRMLAGEASVDSGELVLGKGINVALHDQRPPRERGTTLRDYVLSGARELVAIEAQLGSLEQQMAAGAHDEATLDRYARAQARLEHAGGYRWRERALATLNGLGFRSGTDLDRALDTFSGGELTRASLGRALAGGPDLLLLDEPTNHLDIESLEWLEQHLVGLDAAIVLVAHDRWFLESVGTAVLELEGGRGKFFAGPWHAWRRERAVRELALGRATLRQQAEIERLEHFVARFRAGTRAKQAQSRAKKLARMERGAGEPPPLRGAADGASLRFAFKPPQRSGRVVFELSAGQMAVGERRLLDGAELWLERGEHVSLVGPNGAGKTTLIDALAGRRELSEPAAAAARGRSEPEPARGRSESEPARGRSESEPARGPSVAGKLRTGHNVQIGYLSQHAEELPDSTARTVLEAAQHATGLPPNRARALLGQFLFSGEQAEKPLAGLSGGERRRLSLAILIGNPRPPNVLILDEPTNHLDLESREALERALAGFPGSLLLVSHDRALLDAVGTRTVAFEDGGLRSYAGGWAEYVRVREERAARETATTRGGRTAREAASARRGRKATPPGAPGGNHDGDLDQERIEHQIEAGEAQLRALEDELSDPAAWSGPEQSARSRARHQEAKLALEQLYGRWEQVAG